MFCVCCGCVLCCVCVCVCCCCVLCVVCCVTPSRWCGLVVSQPFQLVWFGCQTRAFEIGREICPTCSATATFGRIWEYRLWDDHCFFVVRDTLCFCGVEESRVFWGRLFLVPPFFFSSWFVLRLFVFLQPKAKKAKKAKKRKRCVCVWCCVLCSIACGCVGACAFGLVAHTLAALESFPLPSPLPPPPTFCRVSRQNNNTKPPPSTLNNNKPFLCLLLSTLPRFFFPSFSSAHTNTNTNTNTNTSAPSLPFISPLGSIFLSWACKTLWPLQLRLTTAKTTTAAATIATAACFSTLTT